MPGISWLLGHCRIESARQQFCPRETPSFLRRTLNPFSRVIGQHEEEEEEEAGGPRIFLHPGCRGSLLSLQASGGWDQEGGPFEPRKAKATYSLHHDPHSLPHPTCPYPVTPFYLLGLCACCFGGRFGSLDRDLRKFNAESPFPRAPSYVLCTRVHFFQGGGKKLEWRKVHEQRKGSKKPQGMSGKH